MHPSAYACVRIRLRVCVCVYYKSCLCACAQTCIPKFLGEIFFVPKNNISEQMFNVLRFQGPFPYAKKKVNKKVVSLLPWPWSRLLLFLPKMRARTHNRIVRHTHTRTHTSIRKCSCILYSFLFWKFWHFLRISLYVYHWQVPVAISLAPAIAAAAGDTSGWVKVQLHKKCERDRDGESEFNDKKQSVWY